MKVLHVISSLDPRGGGPMEGVRQIARVAQSWGQETTVVCLDAPGASYHQGNPFTTVALGPTRLRYGYTPRLLPWLRAHVGEFDAVIVNGLWQYGGLAVWRVLHGRSTPYFVFPHGMLDPYFRRRYPLKHAKKWLYWPWGEYRVLRDARAVLFTCEEERVQARESFWLYRCHEEVAGYGTTGPDIDRAAALATYRADFPGLQDRRVVLFLGRVHPKKGCELLIEGFAALCARAPDTAWHLLIAGPAGGAYEARLRAQAARAGIAQRVTWAGMLSGAHKWGVLHAAEVFALPSHQENFGIAVAEALACGTPVVLSNKVNIWREIVEDEAGFAAPDTSAGVQGLFARWSALDPATRARMRANARACFARRFDMQGAARRIMDTVARLTGQPGPLSSLPGNCDGALT